MYFLCSCRPPDQKQVTIVPVLVGALPAEKEVEFGRIFARYLADPENLFVISSDFCHWGKISSVPLLYGH
jgi:AmmeMemoRadiSam system protein B